MHFYIYALLSAACPLFAVPLTERTLYPRGGDFPAWNHGAVPKYPIHESCNVTERRLIQRGLDDAITLASHAKEHALRFGNSSALYRKYFGDAPSGEVIGHFDRIVNADKANTLFRCDDPDGNCQQPSEYPLFSVSLHNNKRLICLKHKAWGGHWRGANATGETVICPLSYTTRLFLEYFCTRGYTVAGSPLNTYFGVDLLHRLYHLPAIGEGHVEHFAETYEDVLELAAHNSTFAVRDSDALQYFAADVYGYDIAVPGVGCAGGPSTPTPSPPSTTSQAPATTAADVPPVGISLP